MTGWRGVFWVQVPPAVLALVLVLAMLPADRGEKRPPSVSLWSALNWPLASNLLVNLLVAAVMMSTLVVGPFFLGIGLGLTATEVGLVMAVGPVISILSGVPSGRLVDAWGSGRVLGTGLGLLAAGAFLLALLPNGMGVAGYVLCMLVLTPGYQLFQAANNTVALAGVARDRRGTVSGLLSLSRNIGLMVGASQMAAVFAFGAGTETFTQATASAIASGMRTTFLLAGFMMLVAAGIAVGQQRFVKRL